MDAQDKRDNGSDGSFQIFQDAEAAESQPAPNAEEHVQDTQTSLASLEDPFAVVKDKPKENTTEASSSKTPKQPRKARSKNNPMDMSAKDFKELMVQYRLDHHRARAQVVHTTGQVDQTAFWSPQWAGVSTAEEGMNIFDGFDRMWFIPFDMTTPLPLDKQEIADDLQKRNRTLHNAYGIKVAKDGRFYERLTHSFQEEVKETCRHRWDTNFHEPNLDPTEWNDVRNNFDLSQMARMIAEARLTTGKEQLPGYYQVMVLDLGIHGKITCQRASLPTDVGMDGILSRLNSWYPLDDEHSRNIINAFRHKLEIILKRGDEAQKKKAQVISRQTDGFTQVEYPKSERSSWIFKLRFYANFTLPPGKGPDEIRTWTQLKQETYGELLDGVRAKKHPVFVRPWKIRLRRVWPTLDELERQAEVTFGETGLLSEQLDVVDELFACRTDEEMQQAARFKQALDRTKFALLGTEHPCINDNE
ncbi:hypothetical protein F53441_4157 [Fusarium austroafricanum]|uniref:Uncharacterized protein n=1 Tax=Fusarium austroafricanum TaxID=2364996 RepID=A0A8H4KKX9_9HYPO|nr:hypothetical protein F53441_4157 [Fusarium austroafricanum]